MMRRRRRAPAPGALASPKEKENATPPGSASKPRRAPRGAPAASPAPASLRKSSRRRSAAMFESGRRGGGSGGGSAAKLKGYFEELIAAFESSSHAVALDFSRRDESSSSAESTAGLRDLLAVDCVCDDTLSASDLGKRMGAALACLRYMKNFAGESDDEGDVEGGDGEGGSSGDGDGGSSDDNSVSAAERKDLILDMVASLAVDRFTSHSSDMIRLFTACLLSELLRITAPNPPLAAPKLSSVAHLFIEQLLPLGCDPASDPLHSFRFSLLEQLSTVKSILVFADDTQVALDVFAACYALTRASHSHKFTALIANILTTLLEQGSEVLSQPMLDAALAPLIPDNDYSPEAVRLAEMVVTDSQHEIQVPLCNFFNAALRSKSHHGSPPASGHKGRRRPAQSTVGASGLESEDEADYGEGVSPSREELIADLSSGRSGKLPESELLVGVEALLIHIHRIAPDILIYVIPNFERDLCSADVGKRLRCVRLLSSLFTSCPDMVRTYPHLLADFISRSKDADSCIRVELCEVAGRLIVGNPSLREKLSERLGERILDKEEKVRLAAISSFADASAVIENDNLLKLVGDRLKDKKVSVRQAALRSLEVIYQRGYQPLDTSSSAVEATNEDNLELDKEGDTATGLNPASASSFGNRHPWIPACLLEAMVTMYNYKDYDTGVEIELALFYRMHCPNGSSTTAKGQLFSFCAMLGAFDAPATVKMKNAAAQRKRVADSVQAIISLRLKSRGQRQGQDVADDPSVDESSSDEEIQAKDSSATYSRRSRAPVRSDRNDEAAAEKAAFSNNVAELGKRLAATLPDMRVGSSSSRRLALEFAEIADLNAFKSLALVLDPESCSKGVTDAAQDAIARVGTKSVLGEFLRRVIIPKCRPGLFSADHVRICLKTCIKGCFGPATAGGDGGLKDEVQEHGSDCSASSDLEVEPDSAVTDPVAALPAHLGYVRFLDLVSAAMPRVFHGENAALVSEILTQKGGDEATAAELGDAEQVFRCMLVTCCLKVVHSLGRPSFDNWASDILDSCSKMALGWSADPEHCGRHAKWAIRTFVCLLGTKQRVRGRYQSLLRELSNRLDAFDGNLEHLIAPMSALTQLAELCPPRFKDIALSTFDFARALLMGAMSSKVRIAIGKLISEDNDDSRLQHEARVRTGRRLSRLSSGGAGRLSTGSSEVSEVFMFFHATRTLSEVVRRGSKLLVAALGCLESPGEESSTAVSTLVSIAVEKNGNVFGFSGIESIPGLDDLVSDDGSILDAVADMCGVCRLAAGCAILRIGCNPVMAKKILPAEYLSIVLCAQDEHPDIRLMFARKVAKRITKQRLPFRWAASLALMAIDPDKDNVVAVKDLLDTCIRTRRRAVNGLRQSESAGRRSLSHLLPEAILPELVWIAANHPDAAVDEENGYAESERYLDLFFERVLGCGEYASILNQFLNNLSIARDATDVSSGERLSSSQRISDIARVGTALLQKKRSARKWTLIEHEGKVTLPADLFTIASRPLVSSGVGDNDALSVAKRFDRDSELLTKSAERRGRVNPVQRRSTPPNSSRKRAPPKEDMPKSPRRGGRVRRGTGPGQGVKRKSSDSEESVGTGSGGSSAGSSSDGGIENAKLEPEMGPAPARPRKISRLGGKKGGSEVVAPEKLKGATERGTGDASDAAIEALPVEKAKDKLSPKRSGRSKRAAPEADGDDWFDDSAPLQGHSRGEESSKSLLDTSSQDNSSTKRPRRQTRRPSRFV